MTEQTDLEINKLLNPPEEVIQQEEELKGGYIPERWLKIEEIENKRIRSGIKDALQERAQNMTETDIESRRETVRRYFGDLMQEPSFPNGPYAAQRWLNLPEMMYRIVDVEKDKSIVPDVDGRVPFQSLGFDKNIILTHFLINDIQEALPPDQSLSDEQVRNCFTNVSETQLNTVVDQIATSGLSLREDSPREHWKKITAQGSS